MTASEILDELERRFPTQDKWDPIDMTNSPLCEEYGCSDNVTEFIKEMRAKLANQI